MEIIAGSKELQARAVEVHLIKMFVVWRSITRLTSIGTEINHFLGLIHTLDILHMPSTLGDAVDQLTSLVVKIEMSPSVAFAPPDETVALVERDKVTRVEVRLRHTLFQYRHDGILSERISTDIHLLEVTAHAHHIAPFRMVFPGTSLIGIETVGTALLACNDTYHRLCPVAQTHLFLRTVSDVKHIHMRGGSLLTRHLVFIGFQCRTRF